MNCYAGSFSLVSEWPDAWLCHGVARQSIEPKVRIGHAWIEVLTPSGVACIDHKAPDIRIPQRIYYEAGHIETVRRRTLAEAQERVASTGHFGPWDSEIASAAHLTH